MKKTVTLSLASIFAFGLMSFDILYSTGEPDNTGSPADGGANCTSCHSGTLNTGGGSVAISSSPSLASGYTPGADYTISVTVAKTGQTNFGFDFEALKSGNTDGGTLAVLNGATQIMVGAGPTNMVHSDASVTGPNSQTFTFKWTAPAASTGTVTFYASGNAADGDGGVGGDFVYTTSLVVNEAVAAGITITDSDYSSLPVNNFQNTDTLPVAAIAPGAAGANLTWDFTALHADINMTNDIIPPGGGLLSSSFPTANMCLKQGNSDYFYFDKQTSFLDLLGFAGDVLQNGAPYEAVVLSNPETVITFPSSFNTAFNDVSAYDLIFEYNGTYSGIQVDSVREKETATITSLIDAYGTVKTPAYATGFPCIRQFVTKVSIDSTWAKIVNPISGLHYWINTSGTKDTTRSYSYIANSFGPVVDIQMKTNLTGNTNADVSEVKWNPVNPNRVSEYSNSEIRVYPNPSSQYLIINKTSNEDLKLVMYDIMGREVLRSVINGNSNKIPVASLANGTYVLKMFNKGTVVQTNNVIINN